MLDFTRLSGFDSAVGGAIHALRMPALTPFFYACTVLANTGTVVALTTIALLVLAVRRRFAEALLVLAVVAGGETISVTIKYVVARSRPSASEALISLPGDPAFPSGHAIAGILLYGVIAFLAASHVRSRAARVAIAVAAAVLIVLIGVSRVYLGVHWPSDVVGSWIVGGAWLALCASLYAASKRRQARPAS